jgi:outer membrane protein TolC
MKHAWFLLCAAMLFPAALFAGGSRESGTDTDFSSLDELKEFATPSLDENAIERAVNSQAPADIADGAGEAALLSRERMRQKEELTVDVEKAVGLAREYNLSLKSSQLGLVKKRRALSTVWNSFLPTLQVSTTLNRMNEAPTSFDFTTFSAYELSRWNQSFGVDANLYLNLALFDGITATRLNYESGLVDYEQARKQLERDVRKNFYNLLLMQQNRDLFVQQIAAAKDRYDQARINYQNGLVPELTMLSARVAWENLKPTLESMDLSYDQALSGFKMTLGLSQDTELHLDGEISADPIALEADPLIDQYLTGRLDIKSLLYNLKNLDVQRRATISQAFTPGLTVGWSYDPTMNDPFGGDYFNSDSWNQQSGMFRITVAMNLEGFLPGSKTKVELAGIEDDKRSLRLSLMQAIEGAEMEIDSLVKQLNHSKNSMDSLKLNIELADQAYRMAEEAYRAGSRELLEVQNAEIELNNAKYELLKEKYNYVTGLLDLEYALNTTLDKIKEGNDE